MESSTLVYASVVTIGDELMIGQVIDTNSAFLAQQLNQEGFWMRRRVAVGDNYQEMQRALEEEAKHSSIILITGGLGPTADDITKPFLCDYFETKMVINQEVLAHVKHLFENVYKRPLIERNIKQAEVPESCTVIQNPRGTAPGMLFEKNGVIYVSMPGVPHEMKGMFVENVLPLLKQKFLTGHILHRTLLTAGVGESFLAEHITQWESSLPANFKLAYLPNYGMVRLRITGTGNNPDQLQRDLDRQFDLLKSLVEEWLVTDQDLTIPEVVYKLLKERKQSLSTAESCTGGYIAHLITRQAGASDIYAGGVVSYSNEIKHSLLGVANETLDRYGAVSEETVKEMVAGSLASLHTDYAVAVSGIMGPGGGSETKPTGTVWVAVGNRAATDTRCFHFRFDRTRNIELTANNALNMLRKFIIEH